MAKLKTDKTDFSDVVVKLKPIFGIKPEHYVPVLYAILICAFIFFVLFFPGMTKNGTKVTFKTIPEKAPVYVDDVYIGSTPCTSFVKSGNRKIKIIKPFYKEMLFEKDIKGKIFASLFFPRRETIVKKCELADPDGLLQWSMRDAAQFGMLNDFTANYQYPPLLTNAASEIYRPGTEISEKMYNFLHNAMYFVDSEQELWDFLRAISLTATNKGSEKKAFTSFSVMSLMKKIIEYKNKYKGLPFWLSGSLTKVRPKTKSNKGTTPGLSPYELFTKSDWFTGYFSAYSEEVIKRNEQENIRLDTGRRIVVNGITFIYVPDASYIMGNTDHLHSSFYPEMENLPHPVTLKPYYISATEITNKDFSSFVKANPDWLPLNRENLFKNELTTENYLTYWNENSPVANELRYPVTNVSYYAAKAFCKWFSSSLPSSVSRFSARLPREAEWEYAARYIESTSSASLYFKEQGDILKTVGSNENDAVNALKDMFGSVWEWCDNWYFPKDYPLTRENLFDDNLYDSLIGSEKVVRGGCWANSKNDNIRSSSRGSQPPSWCTPYLGFRIVLSEY